MVCGLSVGLVSHAAASFFERPRYSVSDMMFLCAVANRYIVVVSAEPPKERLEELLNALPKKSAENVKRLRDSGEPNITLLGEVLNPKPVKL